VQLSLPLLPAERLRQEGRRGAVVDQRNSKLDRCLRRAWRVQVRLTGGEPTLRSDIAAIADAVSAVPGISRVALSTNGYRLSELLPTLRAAGVSAINISVDSFDADEFHKITGHARLGEILSAIDEALALGFTVKLNTVLLRSFDTLDRTLAFIRERPVTVRFIELMQTADAEFFAAEGVSANALQARLTALGFAPLPRAAGAGPARELTHPDYLGRLGLITPYAGDFCASCNRLRVTARGALKLCLFSDNELPLRDLLQHEADRGALVARVRESLSAKLPSHFLQQGRHGNTHNLSIIGG
jgi:cyclic pyranopterin phosphate synthase